MYRLVPLFCTLIATNSVAKGLSPYLPLQVSPEVENQIEKVMALTDAAPLTKPYKASDLLLRLDKIKMSHPILFTQLSHYLERYTQPSGRTHLAAELATGDSRNNSQENMRGHDFKDNYRISAAGYYQPNAYSILSTGAVYGDEKGLTHYNTYIGFGYEYAQVELGYREHWFSPFQDSAMLVSTHAKASPSITISNATPITDWNIRYEVFYSKLERVEGIRLGNESFPGNPSHAGLHFSFTPLDFWTIGFNRTLQFGGGKREVNFRDVIEALLNPSGKDNVGDITDDRKDDPNYEFGNQQASITSKFNFHWGMPVSLYFEYGGEDTEGEVNYKLGNHTVSAGVFLPNLTDSISLRYEHSHWKNAWYVHHLYRQGYTNDGAIMGHWGGGERVFNDDPYASTHSINVNWHLNNGQILDTNFRYIDNNRSETTQYEKGYQVQVRYSQASSFGFWGAELTAGKDPLDNSYSKLSAFVRW